MNMFLQIFVIGLMAVTVTCETCQTCYNAECSEELISELSCTESTLPSLPYGFQSRGINSLQATYACIDVEYIEGGETEKRKQCVVTEENEDICSDIQSSLPTGVVLKSCSISATKHSVEDELLGENLILASDNIRAEDDEGEEEGSGGEDPEEEEGSAASTSLTVTLFAVALLSQIVNRILQC